ncbi:MAG TPA: LLM class flavin-dependent oxidoreductase [Pseudonocardiaceae bacterium]
MSLNVVTGGSPTELAMDGDHEPHDRRYARTAEFMSVLRTVWAHDGVDFTGEFFRIVGASPVPKPQQPGGIPLYLGGSSERRPLDARGRAQGGHRGSRRPRR